MSINSEQLVNDFCRFLPRIKKEVVEKKKEIVNSFVTIISSEKDEEIEEKEEKQTSLKKEIADTDIFSIDRRIKNEFEEEKKRVHALEQKRKRLEWIKNNAVNKVERIKAEKELFKVVKNINSVLNDENKLEYVERTKNVLDEITKIMSRPVVRSFIDNTVIGDNSKRFRELLQLYFSIASKFTYIDPSILPKDSELKYACEGCGNDVFDVSEEGRRECIECGRIVDVIEMRLTYKDTERINLIPRYNYSKDGHFRCAIDKFQGKQNKTIPPYVYNVIYEEIDKYDIYTRESITKTAIYEILSQHNLGEFYEDLNFIHWKVTGKPPPDISMYKPKLIEMNSEFEKVYDEIKIEIGKDNALNVNHKLTRFLERLGYYVNEEDLIGLKTRNKKIEHDAAMEEAFNRLGWVDKWEHS